MQSIRVLARRINPKLFRRAYRPSFQKAQQEAQDAKEDFQEWKDYEDELSSQNKIAELFHEIDTDGDGKLDQEDLTQALRKGKLPTSHTHMEKLFHVIDTKKTGTIDLEEFTAFVKERKQKLHLAYVWILRHRNSLLENHKGFTASTFRVAAKKAGVHLSNADMELIMKHLDQNGNNYISYKDFVDCLLLAPEINPRFFLDSWYTDAFCDDAESQFTIPREIRVDDQDNTSFAQVAAKKLGCGGLAGAVSRTLTAPIDRIRVLMMTSGEPLGIRGALSTASTGGYARLWMGNGVNCLKIAPEVGIKLLAFDHIKNKIAQDPTNVSVPERFAAGGLAGVLAQVSVYPLETLKTRLAVATPGETLGMTECARRTFAQGGYSYRAFYAGLGPSIVGIIPYAAIDLSLNSILKEQAAEYLQQAKQESSVPVLLGCGMTSSGTAAVLTFPLNVIRTKAQASGDSFGKVVQSLQSQGWRSFYRGLVPCLAKVLPATSISYAAYEYLGGAWDKANK